MRGFLVPITLCMALLTACGGSDSPTSSGTPGNASLSGTVVSGVGSAGRSQPLAAAGLSGVTVRVLQNGQTRTTDGQGDFTFPDVPAGMVDMEFTRADVNARGSVAVAPGSSMAVTAAIVGSKAVITSRGHAGEEIEGVVQSVNAAAGTFTVLDQRLGSVTVRTDANTVLRHGSQTLALSSLAAGNRVHVKALAESAGSYLATWVFLQDETAGGEREITGTVASVDTAAKSFVVTTSAGPVTVKTDASTTYKSKGAAAAFGDLAVGRSVEVSGTVQTDGAVLAKKVTLES